MRGGTRLLLDRLRVVVGVVGIGIISTILTDDPPWPLTLIKGAPWWLEGSVLRWRATAGA